MTLEQRRRFLIHCQMYKILHSLECIKSNDNFTIKNRVLQSHPYSVINPVQMFLDTPFLLMLLISGMFYHPMLCDHHPLMQLDPNYLIFLIS